MADDRVAARLLGAYGREAARVCATGHATEHSYRAALQGLVEGLAGGGARALNEPAHAECGAPDFIVVRDGVPLGHIECKDVGAPLDRVEAGEQLGRYRRGLPNLILTDYLEFRRYANGAPRETARLGRIDAAGAFAPDGGGAARVAALFEAFFSADSPTVASARELAARMAGKARLLRDGVARILAREGEAGAFHEMLTGYRATLIPDLGAADFADLHAQTAAYGLFAARCLHGPGAGPFTRQSAAFTDTTPFLRDVFGQVAGPGIDRRIAWIVDDLALLLQRADMTAILEDFGRRTRREDPVVHFYEDFLAAYDPGLRETRGVYYTPEPVVSYIVRSVDRLLRSRFGLADGLADTAATVDAEGRPSPRVLILDPAAGTGTFLREAVSLIRSTIEDKGLGGGWADYVRRHLLPRLSGFELLMAPYAICHLKLALEIGGPGFALPEDGRLGVYLTNALEEAREADAAGPLFAREVAREAAGADAVKRDRPVMAVIGNPPYSGHSANRGAWIAGLLRGRDGGEPAGSYFEVDGRPLGERNPKYVNDDYVKFFRFAQWRIERTGEGVLGFVTNHNYLDAPTLRGMRQRLMESFDDIYILDLHGNAKKRERAPDGGKDENVFDIQQGVAIGLFVKRADGGGAPARVRHADLWGMREAGADGGKYGWLADNDVDSTRWRELAPRAPFYLFVPRDEALAAEYEAGWRLTDIFPVNSVGIVTARDRLAIRWTPEEMRRAAAEFASLPEEEARTRYDLGRDVDEWKVAWAQEDIHAHPDADAHVAPILYRPFDIRYAYYTGRTRGFMSRPRRAVMGHMRAGPNLALLSCRQQSQAGAEWALCGVTRSIAESCALSNKTREIGSLFPLYVYPCGPENALERGREPNLSPEFVEAARAAFEPELFSEGAGDPAAAAGPEDIFHYIYAVLHSPEYRRRYADFLKSDFPRIPLSGKRELFAALAGLGRRLAALHLMNDDAGAPPAFPRPGSDTVERPRYAEPACDEPGRVWINADQYFEGVSPEAWNFAVGSYRPARKWLQDRKGRALSFDDIAHYRRLCAALAETPRIMARIDRAIDAHGGWPIA